MTSQADSPGRRLLKVLDLLLEVEADAVRRNNGISVQQAADQLEIHRSTANRMMQELLAAGYAVANPAGRGYRIGPAIQTYQGLTPEQRHLSELAHDYLVRLVDLTGECAHTAVASGDRVVVIDDVETGQSLRVVAGRGRRVPMHCTSAGKCLLAFGAAAMPSDMPRRTSRTMLNAEQMLAHLDIVRAQGYALDDEENDLGVRCISAPVFAPGSDEAIGCIGIDGPAVRMSPDTIDQLAEIIVAAAGELSAELAGSMAAASTSPIKRGA